MGEIKISYRQSTLFPRGTTIDGYLPEKINNDLYAKWQPDWPEPFLFHGGAKAISCEMVLEVGEEKITKVYGKKAAAAILEAANKNAAR
jgi:hypothetical protein